jgi:LysM repeat protein
MTSKLLLASALALSACAFLKPVPTTVAVAAPAPVPAPPPVVVEAPDAGLPPELDAGSFTDAVVLEATDAGPAAPEVDEDGTPPAAAQADEATPDDGEPKEVVQAVTDGGYRYTAEFSDEDLMLRWKNDPKSLGSISVGFVEEGRLINGMPFPEGEAWTVVVPESCWTTQETADAITAAARQVREWFPNGPPVRVGQVSGKEGGYLPPHISHQNGRDIDIGLFYPGAEPYRIKEREKVMDVALNWAFAKAILMHGDVQFILLDKRVQKVLYDYALAHGENKQWLDSLFHAGPRSMFFHAKKHRDHFHVRLYNPRAQELAHRLAPLMQTRAEENIAFHRVVKGDTLGGIAHKMGSSVNLLKSVNHLTTTFLKLGQVLKVPMKGPCTNCPVPPLIVVPPRHLPPPTATSANPPAAAKSPQG